MNAARIIVSGANDAYIDYLTDMLASIQDRLHEFDLGILDLGLSNDSQSRIRAFKEDVRILDPGWCLRLPGLAEQPLHKKIYYAKPFLPEIFAGYSGYMWIDADVWLQDSAALAHYIDAAETAPGRGAIAYECHPHYEDITCKPRFRMVWKYGFVPVAVRMVGRKVFRLVYDMFGDSAARQYGLMPDSNSGLFFIHEDSPAWDAWQHCMRKANHRRFMQRDYFPDQTCLNVALRKCGIAFAAMPPIYNWIAGLGTPLYDEATRTLLDPCAPHRKLYAIHLTGNTGSRLFALGTTSGNRITTSLKRSAFIRAP